MNIGHNPTLASWAPDLPKTVVLRRLPCLLNHQSFRNRTHLVPELLLTQYNLIVVPQNFQWRHSQFVSSRASRNRILWALKRHPSPPSLYEGTGSTSKSRTSCSSPPRDQFPYQISPSRFVSFFGSIHGCDLGDGAHHLCSASMCRAGSGIDLCELPFCSICSSFLFPCSGLVLWMRFGLLMADLYDLRWYSADRLMVWGLVFDLIGSSFWVLWIFGFLSLILFQEAAFWFR